MKIKVCGMRDNQNLDDLVKLQPDYIGFIFYPKSKRFVGELWDESIPKLVPDNIKKTGVFVNATLDELQSKVDRYQLQAAQLHGNESVDYCKQAKKMGIEVIKAFPIQIATDFNIGNEYVDVADYFLFDTKTDLFGGSGKKFDWGILGSYNQQKPFFLSGGISVEDADTISALNHPSLYCIDINSRFETEPGLKNIQQVNQFINTIRNGISSR